MLVPKDKNAVSNAQQIEPSYQLVCPRDHTNLTAHNNQLVCQQGHKYPVVKGIPIFLLDNVKETHGACSETLIKAKSIAEIEAEVDPVFQGIDPYVQRMIVGTNGQLYTSLINNLNEYPIPHIRLSEDTGKLLLDIGCGWGRWCISAARKGYIVIGIDPSLWRNDLDLT